MDALLSRRRIVTIETASVADVACLLLGHCLVAGERNIDLFKDPVRILEGELITFCPADRQGIRKRRPSIIRAVDIVPDLHRPLPEVRSHNARRKLFHFLGMAGRFAAGLLSYAGIVSKGERVPVLIQDCAYIVIERSVGKAWKHVPQAVFAGRKELIDMILARHDIQVIVEHYELEHALVRPVRISGKAVAKVAVAAFGVRMMGFLLHLLPRHRKQRIAELCHAIFVRMASNTHVAGLIAGIEIDE